MRVNDSAHVRVSEDGMTPRANGFGGNLAKAGRPVSREYLQQDTFIPTNSTKYATRSFADWSAEALQLPRGVNRFGLWPSVSHRATVVEIDSKALASNVKELKKLLGPHTAFTAVVKANAYGHGAVEVSKIAIEAGADRLAVAVVDEAIELRRAGIDVPILVLGYNAPEEADDIVKYDIIATVCDVEAAAELSKAAIRNLKPVKVHVKVNTGMNRLGISPDTTASFIKEIGAMPLVNVEGMFTHFSCVGTNQEITDLQLERFRHAIDLAEKENVRPNIVHASNSMATRTLPESHFDMVRCGGALYGLQGFGTPVLSWKTSVAHINDVAPGEGVGYGALYRPTVPRKVAAIPVGYGDGLPRGPDDTWQGVLIKGHFAPVRGPVCMDQAMVDVTDIPGVQPGDEVVLLGKQGDLEISLDDAATWCGRAAVPLLTGLSRRNRRSVANDSLRKPAVVRPILNEPPGSRQARTRSFSLGDLKREFI